MFNAGQCDTWEDNREYQARYSGVEVVGNFQAAANRTVCLTMCQETADCNAVTYESWTWRRCWMKKVEESAVPQVISGNDYHHSFKICGMSRLLFPGTGFLRSVLLLGCFL